VRAPIALVLALLLVLPAVPASAQVGCSFKLGFKALADQIPTSVGACLEDEHANPANGDALQKSAGGLLVWRKADNFTAFTDGYRSWVNGPLGPQQRLNTERFDWEGAPPSASASRSGVPDPDRRLSASEAQALIAQDPSACAHPGGVDRALAVRGGVLLPHGQRAGVFVPGGHRREARDATDRSVERGSLPLPHDARQPSCARRSRVAG
jgi:hypothetical protein